jgi:uncharacterized membrane protein
MDDGPAELRVERSASRFAAHLSADDRIETAKGRSHDPVAPIIRLAWH